LGDRSALQIKCARHRVARMDERNHETVALTLFDRPHTVMRSDSFAQRGQ